MSDRGPLAASVFGGATPAEIREAGEPVRGRFPAAVGRVAFGLEISPVPGFLGIAGPFT
jgi:hypothetical protein